MEYTGTTALGCELTKLKYVDFKNWKSFIHNLRTYTHAYTHTHEIKERGDEIFDKLNELKRSKLCSLEIIMLRKESSATRVLIIILLLLFLTGSRLT
jgi:hypothetical protein